MPQPPADHATNTDSASSPETIYRSRCARFAAERDVFARRSRRMANVSTALVVAALVGAGIGVWQGVGAWYLVAALLAVAFLVAYGYHGRIDRRQRRYAELWTINGEGLRRLARDWTALPLRQSTPPADTALATDLDLLGHASLQHLLNTANTPAGQQTLQNWLLHPAALAEIRARQQAVAELAERIDFRDELAVRGRGMANAQSKYEQFLRWAESAPVLRHWHWLVWLSRVLPALTIALIVAQATSLISAPLWAIGVFLNGVLTFTVGRRVNAAIDEIAARQGIFRMYADVFALVTAESYTAARLQQLHQALTAGDLRADQQMQRLGRIMVFADLRLWQFFLVVQLLTLWDFHVLWRFERWQQVAGSRARGWLTALGELEALAALATLKHDHPAWAFPRFTADKPPIVRAQQLAHPLLPPAHSVPNNVQIGPPGTFLLVTGSNMSGKSTLLRAIGVNVVLAQAGGPVCATAMQLPTLILATSMRVQDSLEQGVSYFMAELQRLKAVVDAAERAQATHERTLLFLLDEILHGTNTAERQIAARRIIRHLLGLNAIGAVSTHDLTLAESPDLAVAGHVVHFTEHWTRGPDGPEMRFDYLLRPGIATSTNALKLMELIGLPVDEAAPTRG